MNISNIYKNPVFTVWVMFVLFLQILTVLLSAYYLCADGILSAGVILLHIFVLLSWITMEPVIPWVFTTIGIIFFTVFPGFYPPFSLSLFTTCALMGLKHRSRLKKLDLIEQQLHIEKINLNKLKKTYDTINSNIETRTKKFERVNLIKQMSEALSGQIDIEKILTTVADFTQKIVDPENLLRIYLVNDDMRSMELKIKRNKNENFTLPDQDIINHHIFRENKPILISDSLSDKRFADKLNLSIRSNITTPLMSDDKILGLIRIDSTTKKDFTVSDQIFLANIAHLCALYINNAKLYHLTNKLSVTDSLTNLYTHSFFKKTLTTKIQNKNPFSLLLLDIDNFKQINDRYGHTVGDQILISVSKIIADSVSEDELAARYGGEEFAIIKNTDTIQQGLKIADSLREQIADTNFSVRRKPICVTTSIGVVNYPHNHKDDLMKLVDNALYKAKHNGKNRVETTQ